MTRHRIAYALSVRQPRAALILNGERDTEFKIWATPYRGLLYIHAGKRFDKSVGIAPLEPSRHRAIIGSVRLIYTTRVFPSGCYNWHFIEPMIFEEPIPYPGSPGLMEIDDRLVREKPMRKGRSYV